MHAAQAHYRVYEKIRVKTGDDKNSDFVFVDGGCRGFIPLWMERCPWSTAGLCWPHSWSLAFGDIFKELQYAIDIKEETM
jgi:hypothetical protein